MKEQNSSHLREEHIIRAIVDEKDLDGTHRQHLLDCPDCSTKVARFRDELREFGDNAGRYAPPLTRKIKLPEAKPARRSRNVGRLPFFGAAAAAGLVVFFYLMGMQTGTQPRLTNLQSLENQPENGYMMLEVSEIIDDPLYEDLYEITGENGIGFDEEFMQFVVPGSEDDSQSEFFI